MGAYKHFLKSFKVGSGDLQAASKGRARKQEIKGTDWVKVLKEFQQNIGTMEVRVCQGNIDDIKARLGIGTLIAKGFDTVDDDTNLNEIGLEEFSESEEVTQARSVLPPLDGRDDIEAFRTINGERDARLKAERAEHIEFIREVSGDAAANAARAELDRLAAESAKEWADYDKIISGT